MFKWLSMYKGILVTALVLGGIGAITIWGAPSFMEKKAPVAIEQPTTAPTPAPVVVKPVVKKVAKPIIYINMKEGSFSLNKVGMDMVNSGRYVIHIQFGYIYDIHKIVDGHKLMEYHTWHPNSVDKVTVGLYDTVTGKYVVSVRVM